MQLLELKLRDFQAHTNFKIEFSPTITTIRGATDVGKSTVLRALRWICLNDIAGEDFVREGAKRAGVLLYVAQGKEEHEVFRARGGGSNVYQLNGEEFKSFAATVPDPIASVLRLDEINFQDQHDAPFWFCLSAPEVSRRLNAIIDLSVIDTALANVASEVRTARERVNFCSERVATAEAQVFELAEQKNRIKDWEDLKALRKQWTSANFNYEDLHLITCEIADNKAARLTAKAEQAQDVLNKGKATAKAAQDVADLWRLIEGIQTQERLLSNAPPSFDSVQQAYNAWLTTNEQVINLAVLVREVEDRQKLLSVRLNKLKAAEAKFHEKTKGQKCPLCGQEL